MAYSPSLKKLNLTDEIEEAYGSLDLLRFCLPDERFIVEVLETFLGEPYFTFSHR